MADTNKYIAKIKLSDNSVYYIKDLNALHLSGGTLTGDLEVDAKLKAHDLYILETEYLTETQTPTNVLVLDEEPPSFELLAVLPLNFCEVALIGLI